jgi:hypothetical protein
MPFYCALMRQFLCGAFEGMLFPNEGLFLRSRALFRRGHARPRTCMHAPGRTHPHTHPHACTNPAPSFLFPSLSLPHPLRSAPLFSTPPAYTLLPCPPLPSSPLFLSPSPSLLLVRIGPTWDDADLIVQVPLTPAGKPDFETVDALDSQRLTDDLISILSGEVTEIPRYSFKDNNPLPRQAVALLTTHPFFSQPDRLRSAAPVHSAASSRCARHL